MANDATYLQYPENQILLETICLLTIEQVARHERGVIKRLVPRYIEAVQQGDVVIEAGAGDTEFALGDLGGLLSGVVITLVSTLIGSYLIYKTIGRVTDLHGEKHEQIERDVRDQDSWRKPRNKSEEQLFDLVRRIAAEQIFRQQGGGMD